jgi:hypothetical protein
MSANEVYATLFAGKDREAVKIGLHMMLEDGPTSFIPSHAQAMSLAVALEAHGWPDLAAVCRAWVASEDYVWPDE